MADSTIVSRKPIDVRIYAPIIDNDEYTLPIHERWEKERSNWNWRWSCDTSVIYGINFTTQVERAAFLSRLLFTEINMIISETIKNCKPHFCQVYLNNDVVYMNIIDSSYTLIDTYNVSQMKFYQRYYGISHNAVLLYNPILQEGFKQAFKYAYGVDIDHMFNVILHEYTENYQIHTYHEVVSAKINRLIPDDKFPYEAYRLYFDLHDLISDILIRHNVCHGVVVVEDGNVYLYYSTDNNTFGRTKLKFADEPTNDDITVFCQLFTSSYSIEPNYVFTVTSTDLIQTAMNL